MSELSEQVAREAEELRKAPLVQYGPTVHRCQFCGQPAPEHELQLVEIIDVDGDEPLYRYMGGCCAKR